MIPQCIHQGVGIIPWSPLARGVLAGNRGREGERRTTRSDTDGFTDYLYSQPTDFDVVERVAEVAAERNVSAGPGGAGLATRASPGVTAPIVGATKPSHLADALAAEELTLTDEEWPASRSPTCLTRSSATSDGGARGSRGGGRAAPCDRREYGAGVGEAGDRPDPGGVHDQPDPSRAAPVGRLPLRHHVPLRLPDFPLDAGGPGPSRPRGAVAVLQSRGDQPGRGEEAPLGAGLVLRLVDDADRRLPAPRGSRAPRPLVPGGRSGAARGGTQAPPARRRRGPPGRDGTRPGHGAGGHRRPVHRRRGPRRARPGGVPRADSGSRRWSSTTGRPCSGRCWSTLPPGEAALRLWDW